MFFNIKTKTMTYREFLLNHEVQLLNYERKNNLGEEVNYVRVKVSSYKDKTEDVYSYSYWGSVEPNNGNMKEVELICKHLKVYIETKIFSIL